MRRLSVPAVLVAMSAASALAAVPPANGEFTPVYHPQLETSRAAGPIAIDGVLDDPGWQGIPRAENFAEHSPGDQVRPPVDTHAMITYDDDHLYIAYVCRDDPALVRASLSERDNIWSDDYVITAIDTYGDQTWAYEIACNPLGVQGDLLWSANAGEDMSYNMVFASAGRVTGEGWQVELAIPWSSLRFPNRDEQVWRVDFWRNHPRAVRGQYSWAAYDRDESSWPSQWGTIAGIRGVEPGKGIELLPSQVFTQAGSRRGDGFDNDPVLGQASLGARANLSSSFTVEGTINPDFSQIESDAAQIDVNTTLALFFPEQRPFFQEGSDLFNTFFNAVYTRTINDPLFAAKVTGRPGSTSVAYLVARDEVSPFILPFEDVSAYIAGGRSTSNILRVQQALGDGASVGVLATDRRIDGGGAGSLGGIDGRVRFTPSLQFEWQALASRTEEPDDQALTDGLEGLTFDNGARTAVFDGETYEGLGIYSSLEYNDRLWDFDVDYWSHSPTFRADNGFIRRNNRREAVASASRVFRYEDSRLLEWIQPHVNAGRAWTMADERKDEWIWAGVGARLRQSQLFCQLSHMKSNELFGGIWFDGIDATEFNLQAVPSSALQGGLELSHGHRIARRELVMGRESNATLWFDLRPADRLLAEVFWRWTQSVDDETEAMLFKGYILRSRLGVQVSRELSLRLVLQYDDFDQTWEADPLVTYRLNPFSIFYVGSTRDYAPLDPEHDGVRDWRLTDRQYFMKLQYLFQI
ncbi:MAG: hypothetical protein C0395_04955 [Gemmatimonas sp.]|nr:hypothetical protein [Gemmatimonas sp.]